MSWEIVDIQGLKSLRINDNLLSNMNTSTGDVYSGTSNVFQTDIDNFANVYTPTDGTWGYVVNDTDVKIRYKSYINTARNEHWLQSGITVGGYTNDDTLYSPSVASYDVNIYGYVICINRQTQRAQVCWAWRIYYKNTTSIESCWIYKLVGNDAASAALYTYIIGHPPVVWKPFGALAGNNGQFQMELSQINKDIIGDGSTQASSADPSNFIISRRSSLYNLSVNMLDGQEYTIAYCGDNYLTCKKRTVVGTQSTSIYLTLKFYFRSDTLIYTTPEIQITRIGTTAPNDYYLSIIFNSDGEIAAPDLINEIFVVSDNVYYYNNFGLPSNTEMQALYIWLQDNANAQSGDPYGTGSTDDGGDPNGPRSQDNLPDSSIPTTGGLNLSIVTLYTPTDTELSAISAFLWSNDVLDNFKKYFNNFADNILCLYSLPFKPSGTLPTKAFKVGNITSDNPTLAAVEYCTVRYFDIDMGSYDLESKWGSYLDYAPYTKIEIYLPYIGLHSLDIDELMSPSKNDGTLPTTQGCTISLVYRLDIITGIIVAKIKVNGQIRYQFTGKVGATIPLTGQTYSNLVNSIITAGAGLATTIATGGLTAPMSAAATVTATIQAQKPQVTSVGNITGDASMLATDIPYLRISTPNKPLLEDQQVFTGFPSYKAGTLSNFTGYTEVVDAHVEGISCTEEERAKILTYLKDGVII